MARRGAAAPRRWQEVLGVFQQVGVGLAAAHAAGVVHRDVKPDNILVGDDGRRQLSEGDGRVLVADFSLARPVEGQPSPLDDGPHDLARTRAGALIGTPLYMSPEQIDGQPADAAGAIAGRLARAVMQGPSATCSPSRAPLPLLFC